MKTYARIDNGIVCELVEIEDEQDITQMFHPSLNLREAPAGCLEGWRVHDGQIVPPDDYKILRTAAYPPIADFIDGMVKINSPDPDVQAEGDAQVQAYCAACLEIKAQFPKPA